MTQLDYIKKIIALAKENPRLEIKFFIDNEELSECHAFSTQEIRSVKLEYWYDNEVDIITGFDAIVEKLEEEKEREVSEGEAFKYMDRVILVTLGA